MSAAVPSPQLSGGVPRGAWGMIVAATKLAGTMFWGLPLSPMLLPDNGEPSAPGTSPMDNSTQG